MDKLLESLARQTVAHETLVLDNGSPGSEVSVVCERFPFARAIRHEQNLGYGVPVNRGAAEAAGKTLVLLNDDCVCDPPFIERICAALDPQAGVVMAAGVMRQLAAPELIDTAGMQLDRTLLVYDYLNGRPLSELDLAPDPVGPSAAAAAFDRTAFLDAGGFDERLFAYWEDVDLVLRLLRAGGRCRLAHDALGTHEHSATLGAGSAAKNRLMGYGRGYLLRKWRVLTPRRALPVLSREAVLVLGQMLMDRNAAGLPGRVAGWRAAEPSEPFPQAIAERGGGDALAVTLGRRLRRRLNRA